MCVQGRTFLAARATMTPEQMDGRELRSIIRDEGGRSPVFTPAGHHPGAPCVVALPWKNPTRAFPDENERIPLTPDE